MSNWVNITLSNDGTKDWFVEFEFESKAEAEEFMKMAQICKDVSDELLFYGDGVLRTIDKKGKKNDNRRSKSKKVA